MTLPTRDKDDTSKWHERLPAATANRVEQAAVFAIATDGRSCILDAKRRQRIARSAIAHLLDGGSRPKACDAPPTRDFFNAAMEAARAALSGKA